MENKKTKIISTVAIVALALTVITATYAYFNASIGDPAAADIKINANTVDTFTFSSGSAISFSINQDNFASGKGNQTGSTYASAMLTANNKTNTATEHYYLYLSISDNTFTYSINESTPEIIMTITDNAGTEVTDISTLTHVIVTGANGAQVSGYDITNKNGLITLFNNREITTTSSKEEKWNITITFVNYDESQNANAGKSMSAKVMIQKNKLPEIVSDVCSGGENLATCITTLSNKSSFSLTNIYHHDANLTNGAGDNSYRYAGEDYVLTDAGKAAGATMMVGNNNTVTTALIDFYCNGTKQYVGYGCSLSHYYLIKGDTTQYRTYTEALNASVEKGYLTKGNVKNFVCFGSTEIPCPDANSFRIIGVFGDQVKVIRAKSVGIMQWDNSGILELGSYGSNTWSTSSLNTYLNGEYLTGLATLAENIASTTWKVGGNTWENIGNQPVKTAYQNEIVSPVTTNTTDGATEYSAKIGLMYVSDYGYAASPGAWTTMLDHYDSSSITSVNWIYMELYEWTISRYADDSGVAFEINQSGEITANPVDSHLEIRPSFYLLPSITYVSGEGTQNSPIIIN